MKRCLLLLALAACAPDLREEFPFDGELPDGVYLVHEDLGDGVTRTTVDATHRESWVYFDFDGLAQVGAADAAGGKSWELAFQRFKIISNSGISGAGDVAVAVLPGQTLGGLTRAPADGYLTDAADGPDENTDLDSAFLVGDGWYAYDLGQHKVLPREALVYVVRTSEGRYFALQLVGYYDAAGTGAKPSFDWKWVAGP